MSYSSILKSKGTIQSKENLPIHYDLYTPSTTVGSVFQVIIFVHGFKGFKDWGAFPDACEELARAGFAVLAFNHSKNGVGENMLEFDEPDLFANQTLTNDLEDIGSILEALKNKEIQSDKVVLDTDRVGIIGHSRGAHTAIAAAAEYSEIYCMVTWSAVANYNSRWSDQMKKDWKEKGFTEIKNSRTGQVLKLNSSVYEDATENADRLMASLRVKELHTPCMFIAGKDDESVSHNDSEILYRNCPSDDKEIRLIENAGHTFNVSHPFNGEDFPEEFEEVLNFTEDWFHEHFK